MEEVRNPLPEVVFNRAGKLTFTDTVSVVACGPSALKCGAERAPGFVIAVNDAYRHVRHDAVLSMDGRWARYRAPELGDGPPLYLRRSAAGHCDPAALCGFKRVVHIFDCDHTTAEFAEKYGTLNGRNSGYCALNLAYQLRPRVVYLFGFDHKGNHFHKESEWRQRGEGCSNSPRKFAEWADDCEHARRFFDRVGIRVINTNPDSLVRAFKFGDAP